MTVDKMTVDKMTVDKMTVDKMTVNKMTVDEMTVNKMTVNKMTVDEMTVDKTSFNELTSHQTEDLSHLSVERRLPGRGFVQQRLLMLDPGPRGHLGIVTLLIKSIGIGPEPSKN
jgi:hypothetical protein